MQDSEIPKDLHWLSRQRKTLGASAFSAVLAQHLGPADTEMCLKCLWGFALWEQAKTKSGEAADALFAAAGEKYAAALAIKPDTHEPLNNWGLALSEQAKSKSGEAADPLFAAAGEKYAAALAIKPDMHEGEDAILASWARSNASEFLLKIEGQTSASPTTGAS